MPPPSSMPAGPPLAFALDAAEANTADIVDALAELGLGPDDGARGQLPTGELSGQHVTAVLVCHDGARWLPATLAALERLTRQPDELVVVDAGGPSSLDLAGRVLPVVAADPTAGFGAAVRAGLAAVDARTRRARGPQPRVEWVWLLHDDCAPGPDALQRLLELAVRRPDAGVLGPKTLEWRPGGRRLLELGVTVTATGRRYTGLEPGEYDQGQHDSVREVLGVGSAGMLVRRDVWDALGGFDPELRIFRDDLDFGWRANSAGFPVLACPEAVVRHAEAAARGQRPLAAAGGRASLVDRRHALFVLLANGGTGWRFPALLVWIVLATLLRAAGFLLGKQPALAAEELRAMGWVLRSPRRLARARRARAATRTVPVSRLRHLFPGLAVTVRSASESIRGLRAGTGGSTDGADVRRRAAGPGDEEDEPPTASLGGAVVRPGVVLTLAALTLVAVRGLVGEGRLLGGALLPAPDAVSSLWQAYAASWHPIGLGSGTPMPPYVAVVAAVGTLLGGSASLPVDALLLASVPLAGLSAWASLRGVLTSRMLRGLGAVVWGLVPATTGAVAAGRIGTAATIVLLPMVLRAAVRAVDVRGPVPPLRRAFAAGLLLGLAAAVTPVVAVIALVAGLATVLWDRRARTAVRAAVVVALPAVLLLPWSAAVASQPALVLTEPGLAGPGLSDASLPAWRLLLGDPGGPGTAPAWTLAGIACLALAALLSRGRGSVLAAWLLALLGLSAAVVLARVTVPATALGAGVRAWPGPATAVFLAGLLLAGLLGAEAAPGALAARRFGWRHVAAAALAVLVLGGTLGAAAWWAVRGAADPLARRNPTMLPAYVAEDAAGPDRPRTLVLRVAPRGPVSYALLRETGPQLGDAEVAPSRADAAALDAAVADLLSARGGDPVGRLSRFAVRYVFVPAPASAAAVRLLDSVPGLDRASAPEGSLMWRLAGVTSRVRVVNPSGSGGPAEASVGSDAVDVDSAMPAGPTGRTLLLAERADQSWIATLDGVPLTPVVVDGWAQGFRLPPDGGHLVVTSSSGRTAALLLQLLLVAAVAVMALPGLRRDRRPVDGTNGDDDERAAPIVKATSSAPTPDPYSVASLLRAARGARSSWHRGGPARRHPQPPMSAEDWLSATEPDDAGPRAPDGARP